MGVGFFEGREVKGRVGFRIGEWKWGFGLRKGFWI